MFKCKINGMSCKHDGLFDLDCLSGFFLEGEACPQELCEETTSPFMIKPGGRMKYGPKKKNIAFWSDCKPQSRCTKCFSICRVSRFELVAGPLLPSFVTTKSPLNCQFRCIFHGCSHAQRNMFWQDTEGKCHRCCFCVNTGDVYFQ